MIVVPKFSESNSRIENLTLTASTPEDYELLAALFRDYTQGGVVEITLRDGQGLKSALTEKRRGRRISMRLPVLLLWEEGGVQHREHTFTLQLSRFGCAIHSHRFFQPKTLVQLQYEGKAIDAHTVYALSDHSINKVEVGIDFGGDSGDFWGIAALSSDNVT
jgi:hypothetical protein